MTTQRKNKTGKTNGTSFKLLTFIILILGVTFASCNKDDDFNPKSTLQNDIANQDYIDILENRLKNLPVNSQIAIGLVHNGNTEFLGVINDNSIFKGVNNADKVFEIGSITKVFNSVCLSDLLISNEALLTETLQSQFNFTLKAGGNITLEQLANHTSGLPRLPTNIDEVQGFNPEDPYAIYTYDNLKNYLQNHVVLNAPSGTLYEYSNLGVGILGYILAQKNNSTYEQLVKSKIFNPLGMNNSTTLLTNVETSKLVEPRDINGNIVSHWNFAETMAATGSIKSSVQDMTKFIEQNFENDAVYNLPQQTTFDRGNNLYMGLGWTIYEADGYRLMIHDGGTGGFSSILMLDKNKRIGVVILANVENFHESITPMCNDFILEISK